MRARRLSLMGLIALLISVPAFAQRVTATIRGTVTDESGAVIPGASVTVKGEETGYTRTTTTNAAGLYTFAELPVGTYTVQVDLTGFKSAVTTGIVLNVAAVRAVDAKLTTGAMAEQVTVEASANAVQTIGGDVSGLVTGEQVRELPLNGRNFLQLALLMPGVTAPDFLNVKDKGLLGGSDVSVSGGSVTSNLWTVDGANNNDVGSNRTILVYPSVDAIEEFKILRNSYGAEYGQSGGAQINLVTRGGTNDFHGSAFYFGRRDALNSKNYFLEQAGKDKEKLKRNDFGWTFGGPIAKDKLHFFLSQEWNREVRGSVRTAFVPTAEERAGNFSGAGIAGCTGSTPTDPLTGLPFPGNRIPSNRLSPGGQLLLQLYPLPNTTPGEGSCNNWVDSINSPINWRQENVRVDWSLSDRTHLMVRYTQDHWTNAAPSLQANLWGDDPFPAVDSNWEQPGRSLVVQLNNNIGSKAVNSLVFSYSANVITGTRGGTDPGLNARINAAIPGIFPDSIKEYGGERGHPIFWGGGGYDALWNFAPFKNNEDLFVIKDDYSAVFGKHFVKVGALASYNKKNEDFLDDGSAESSQFSEATGLNGTGATTGNILSDFLLRDMAFGFSEVSADRVNQQRWKDLEAYVSDSWKVHPRLTVDYGVRYSRLIAPYTADDTISSFNPSLFKAELGSDPCNGLALAPGKTFCKDAGFLGGTDGPSRALTAQKNLFAPRLGVAWDVKGTGKTALRVGLGKFYQRERLTSGLALAGNPPFAQNRNGSRVLDTAAEPCDGCFSVGNGAPSQGIDPSGTVPYNWQWNLMLQQEIFRNTTVEVGYVGSKGGNLLKLYDINQVPQQNRLAYARSQDAAGSGEFRPFNVFGNQRITFWGHEGSSKYHSLQTQLLSRFGHGSQVQLSYTWSKTTGDVPLDDSGGSLSADASVSDLGRPELDRGLARTHRAHVFNASLVLALPKLDSRSSFVKNVFGDWEIASIAVASSGSPITIYTGVIPDLNGGPSGTGYNDNQRPNRVAGQPCRGTGLKEQFINPAAFTLNGFQLGTFGDAGRGICEGPSLVQLDLSLYKNVKLSERAKLQLRFEVFNVLNRVNFSSQGFNNTINPSSVTFDTGDPATANRITSFTPSGGFGQATATRDPRQAQFGVKLIF
jgi:hypothetical protein